MPALILRRTAYFVQTKTSIILPGDAWRTTIFGAKLEVGDKKCFIIFHFLQSDMVSGIVYQLSWTFNAISNEKSWLILMPFLSTYIDVRAVTFPACWILIGQFKFPTHQPYARTVLIYQSENKMFHSQLGTLNEMFHFYTRVKVLGLSCENGVPLIINKKKKTRNGRY